MAPVPLNVVPAFRPWRQAGITHLLFDEATAARLRQASARSRPAPSTPAATTGRDLQFSERTRTGKSERTPQARPVSDATEAAPHSIAAPRRLAPDRWPGYWRALLERTPRAPEVVWTYPSLSRDLGGAADASHRDFLRRLLGDMGMPRGANAFWPLNAYPYESDDGENSVDASMFMSGVDALDPDMVLLMCGRAPAELGLSGLGPLIPTIIRGRRFVVTPHVDDLILQPSRYAQLVSFLKGLIARR